MGEEATIELDTNLDDSLADEVARIAKAMGIEAQLKDGKLFARPKRRTKVVQVRLYEEEHAFLDKLAEDNDTSMANICRAIWFVASTDDRFKEAIQDRLKNPFK
jgi:hypothetical protein